MSETETSPSQNAFDSKTLLPAWCVTYTVKPHLLRSWAAERLNRNTCNATKCHMNQSTLSREKSREWETGKIYGQESQNLRWQSNPHVAPADIQYTSVRSLWRMFVSLSCWAGGCYVALWWDESLSSLMRLWRRWQESSPGLGGGWVMSAACTWV